MNQPAQAQERTGSFETSRTLSSFVPPSSASQPYQSVWPSVQFRLQLDQEDGRNKNIAPGELEIVRSIFRFAETNRPATGLGVMSDDELEYRSEYNVWCYYFDDATSFPGKPPTPDLPPPKLSVRAQSCKDRLIDHLSKQKDFGPNYTPQMGWNPKTGEPWLAFRSYANNSYPAISGPYNSHAKEVETCIPEFKLMYQRFRKEGYVLIWPEFSSARNLSSPSAWERFARYRAFLHDWAGQEGELQHINDACRAWTKIPFTERRSEALPQDFKLGVPILAASGKATNVSTPDQETQETLRDRSQEHDCWRPEPGSYERVQVDNQSPAFRGNTTCDEDRREDYNKRRTPSVKEYLDTKSRYEETSRYHKEVGFDNQASPHQKYEVPRRTHEQQLEKSSKISLGRRESRKQRARSRSPRSEYARHDTYRERDNTSQRNGRSSRRRDSLERDNVKSQRPS